MSGESLQGMKVAILVTDGFEQVELTNRARRSIKPAPIPVSSPPRGTKCAVGISPIGANLCRSI